MDKYGFIVQNDLLKVMKGIKQASKLNSQELFLKRRSEFAAMTREGYSMCEIAKKYNITRQAVSLALQKAVKEGHTVHKSRAGISDSSNYVIISRKKPPKEVVCSECNKKFLTDKNHKTCSKECRNKAKEKTYGGEWSRVEFLDLICKGCGKSFKRSKYLQKINETKKKSANHYCSRNCYCNTKRLALKFNISKNE